MSSTANLVLLVLLVLVWCPVIVHTVKIGCAEPTMFERTTPEHPLNCSRLFDKDSFSTFSVADRGVCAVEQMQIAFRVFVRSITNALLLPFHLCMPDLAPPQAIALTEITHILVTAACFFPFTFFMLALTAFAGTCSLLESIRDYYIWRLAIDHSNQPITWLIWAVSSCVHGIGWLFMWAFRVFAETLLTIMSLMISFTIVTIALGIVAVVILKLIETEDDKAKSSAAAAAATLKQE